MCSYLYEDSIFLDHLKLASEKIQLDMLELLQGKDPERLNSTIYTQPALLASSVGIWKKLQSSLGFPLNPAHSFMAGHSLGEYSALCAAEAIEYSAAIELVHIRGKLMQQACAEQEVGMSAILGLDPASIVAICKSIDNPDNSVVSAVNFNSPEQTVIAGHKSAVEKAAENCKAKGAKRAISLPVSIASHCAIMNSVTQKLQAQIEKSLLRLPSFPVVQNYSAQPETSSLEKLQENLAIQVEQPVLWNQTIDYLLEQGVGLFIEIGAGKVLTNLMKKIAPQARALDTNSQEAFDKAVVAIREAQKA